MADSKHEIEDDTPEEDRESIKQFDSLGLDARLVKALHHCGIVEPTPVQQQTIPLALQKKDILMRAKTGIYTYISTSFNLFCFSFFTCFVSQFSFVLFFFFNDTFEYPCTIEFVVCVCVCVCVFILFLFLIVFVLGSGKTLAFLLPLLENLLQYHTNNPIDSNILSQSQFTYNNPHRRISNSIKCIILAPTRELVSQIGSVLSDLTKFCHNTITYYVLSGFGKYGLNNEKPRLLECPNILVSTPARISNHLKEGNLTLSSIEYIIIDEADLIMTHDFENDIKTIVLSMSGLLGNINNINTTHNSINNNNNNTSINAFHSVNSMNSSQNNNGNNGSIVRPQIIMCSATLNPHTAKLQEYFLMHHPIIVEIDESGFDNSKLKEYYFQVSTFGEKFLLMYGLFNLNIIKGKCIVFVHNIDLSYRLKLFLEKFMIPSAVLNPTLPYNSRQSVIDKFNRGMFKYLITTDAIDEHERQRIEKLRQATHKQDTKEAKEEEEEETNDDKGKGEAAANDVEMDNENEDENENDNENETEKKENNNQSNNSNTNKNKSKNKNDKKDKKKRRIGYLESKGLIAHRGVDFREVCAVINFSAPFNYGKYVHRIGRTARAGNYGVALTLATPREMEHFSKIIEIRNKPKQNHDDSNDNIYQQQQQKKRYLSSIQELPLSMNDLNAFKYRCDSVRCSITSKLVKHARMNELRMEVLNSKRLSSHFKNRQREYELLRHDKMLQPADMVKPHLSHVPSYMLANTNLKIPKNKYGSATQQYKRLFGQLPSTLKEHIQKKRLRKAMKYNPGLRKQVLIRRRYNLSQKKKMVTSVDNNSDVLHKKEEYSWLNKSTTVRGDNAGEGKIIKDGKVFKKPVRHWKHALKNKYVMSGRRKPSMRGMSKKQRRMVRKRQKLKKMGRRKR